MNKKKKFKTKSVGSPHDLAAEDSDDTGSRALRLEITRIKLYERNPRRSKNPEYDRIKASILKSGMDQGLLVTQRPGNKDYIVQAGGNTRLQILKELFGQPATNDFSGSTVCLSNGTENLRCCWPTCEKMSFAATCPLLIRHEQYSTSKTLLLRNWRRAIFPTGGWRVF